LNQQVLYGDGVGTNLHGFFTTPNIIVFDAATSGQGLDAVEQAITALRVGPSLATADLLLPSTRTPFNTMTAA
jgi:hypothetical protein